MHFIKFIRIWAGEKKIPYFLNWFYIEFFFNTLYFCQHASSAARTHAEDV